MNSQLFTFIQITYTIALPLVIAMLSNKVQKHLRANDNGRETDMLVLRLILIDLHDQNVSKGYISRFAFTTFEDIWRLYHDGYGGNTLTDRFHEEVLELPIKEGTDNV